MQKIPTTQHLTNPVKSITYLSPPKGSQYAHMRGFLRACMLIFLFCSFHVLSAQNFSIDDEGNFIDPEGNIFIPIGANVNPWNYFNWEKNWETPEHQAIWTDCWRFNFMRAPVYMTDLNWNHDGDLSTPNLTRPGWVNNPGLGLQELKKVVDIYTPKKVVVMFDAHNFIGRFPSAQEVEEVKNYFRTLAQEFKDNPYVWFNLFNEPGQDAPANPFWREMHQDVIEVIRDEEGADNMIVCTGTQWGQECKTYGDEEFFLGNSAIYSFGDDLINFNGKSYDNIAFDVHVYDQWANDDVAFENKFKFWLDAVKEEKKFALLIGEVGTPPQGHAFNGEPFKRHLEATGMAYEIALKEYGIGMVHWHWDPEDNFTLINYAEEDLFGPDGKKQNGGIHINDCENPTNLSPWGGFFFWKATHEDGFGLQPSGGGGGSQSAFNGVKTLPGIVQAEDFDNGGQGVAYNDTDASNNGGTYRTGEGVDIQLTSDAGGGNNVGWTTNGEWIEYTVNVSSSGTYNVDLRHASPNTSTVEVTFSNGGNSTGNVSLAATGGWQNWNTTTQSGVFLNAGQQIMRINFKGAGVNINYIGVSAGSTPAPTPAPGTCTNADGFVIREVWTGISGKSTALIPVSTAPSSTNTLTSLEGPTNVGGNYGTRIRGYIVPPSSGTYTFYIASDDNSKLFLSSNDNPNNASIIAQVNSWTSSREWGKFPSQQSSGISLTACQPYYFEVLQKEEGGGDNLAVGWTGPGFGSITVIDGDYLSPFTGATPPPAPVPTPSPGTCNAGDGFIVRELWTGISGTTADNIPTSTFPNSTSILTSLEGPTNVGSNYGARIRGYVIPPSSGSYTFYISGDDNCRLLMSTNSSPSNLSSSPIASVPTWTSPKEWGKFPSQSSSPRTLNACEPYYFEVLHKEGGGGDNLAVGWTGPGIGSITVIESDNLSSFGGASVSSASVGSLEMNSQVSLGNRFPEFHMYPNPVEGLVSFRWGKLDLKSIQLMDATGKLIKEKIPKGRSMQMKLSHIPAGVYLIRVLYENGERDIRKLMVK